MIWKIYNCTPLLYFAIIFIGILTFSKTITVFFFQKEICVICEFQKLY